ncbi:MAG: hypothetical protein K2O40_09920 [Lachnospiraceae bacterium]|nr:hypothetical protein [Lachnospiraceae bacterium]
MNDLLRKIYEEAAVYSKEGYEVNHKLEYEVGNMIAPYTMKLTEKEKKALEDVFFDVCDKGKELFRNYL